MAPDPLFGEAHLESGGTNFILKHVAERLDQLQAHIGGQAPHIVVGLDRGPLSAIGGTRLDHIRVKGALSEKLRITEGASLPFEDAYKLLTNNLPLPLRISDSGEGRKEFGPSIDRHQWDLELLAEGGDHLLSLIEAE